MRRERRPNARGVRSRKAEPTSMHPDRLCREGGFDRRRCDGQHSLLIMRGSEISDRSRARRPAAFGRVRDEARRATGWPEEPFVNGPLGGGNISLVPAPKVCEEAPASDIKADYELVQRSDRCAPGKFSRYVLDRFLADLARVRSRPRARRGMLAARRPPPSAKCRAARR